MSSVYRLSSFNFLQMRPENILATLGRWQQAWAAWETPRTRLVFRTIPVDLESATRRARRSEAAAQDDGATQHVRQYIGLLDRAAHSGSLLALEHYLVLPTLSGTAAEVAAGSLAEGLGLHAQPVADLPPLLPTAYHALPALLQPESGNYPLCSVLVSYDLMGQWDWGVLAQVLTLGFPLALSVELLTYHGEKANQQLDNARQLLSGISLQVGRKAGLTKQETDYQTLEAGVTAGLALHHAGFAVLVSGRTEKELRERERQIGAKLAGRAAVRRINGLQQELFQAHFTAAERPEIPTGLRHNLTSQGAALLCGPLGLRRRTDLRGILWGMSGQQPYFWDGFGPQLNELNHAVILGAPGTGKTTTFMGILWREMDLEGTQGIIMEPMGHCKRLVRALGEKRSAYNPLSLHGLRINPIELIYEDAAEQSAHLTVILKLLLKRALTEHEEVALDMAQTLIYAGVNPQTPAVNQPRLENLARALRTLRSDAWVKAAGENLGSLLEAKYVRGSLGTVFNTPTLSDWKLEKDLVAFDFSQIPEEAGLMRLGYYLVLSAIQRAAFRQARSRRRIVLIDEFRAMSAEPMLAGRVALMFKTFRTLGVGIWAMEQDIFTFTGADESGRGFNDNPWGPYMLSNSAQIIALAHRTTQGIRILQQQRPQITDEQAQWLMSLRREDEGGTGQDKGKGLVILENEVYPVHFVLTQHELKYLKGS